MAILYCNECELSQKLKKKIIPCVQSGSQEKKIKFNLPPLRRIFKYFLWVSLVAQLVKNLPALGEAWVQSLGWEDPLEKGKATHSSILAWRRPWTV